MNHGEPLTKQTLRVNILVGKETETGVLTCFLFCLHFCFLIKICNQKKVSFLSKYLFLFLYSYITGVKGLCAKIMSGERGVD